MAFILLTVTTTGVILANLGKACQYPIVIRAIKYPATKQARYPITLSAAWGLSCHSGAEGKASCKVLGNLRGVSLSGLGAFIIGLILSKNGLKIQ